MKSFKTLLLCGVFFCVLFVSSQTKQNKYQEKKIKQTDIEIKKQTAELQASIWENPQKTLRSKKWILVSYLADGIPSIASIGGKDFPKGTEFVFGTKGLGFTKHNGVRISNFYWKANRNVLTLEYAVEIPYQTTKRIEKDQYTILSLLPDKLVIATEFDQEMKAKIRLQQQALKLNINDMTNVILAFVPAE